MYGYHGADRDAEQLSLTDQLFDAALGELGVVALDQPCLIVGDFNVEPTKIPCLSKGIFAGLWVDLESAWAFASGVSPSVTCKRAWDDSGGHRRDFMVGCPLATAAVRSCSVQRSRWIVPHLAVRASFAYSCWTCQVSQPVKRTPLWPASWLPAIDKTRGSKSVEVQKVWEIYDDRLQFMSRGDALGLDNALLCGDVSSAWMIWSSAAEGALADAFRFAGGPVPDRGLVLGRGKVRIRTVRLGGPIVRSVRRGTIGDGEFDDVSLYRDYSAAPVLDLRRNLRAILDLLDSISRSGASLARDVQLVHLWDSVVRLGSLGSVHVQEYEVARVCGLVSLVGLLLSCMVVFRPLLRVLLPIVVVLVLLLGVTGFGRILWFILINGCGLIWFLLLPFCSVIVLLLLGVLVFLLILLGLMKNSERPGFPIFVALDKGRPALMNSILSVLGGCLVWMSSPCRL